MATTFLYCFEIVRKLFTDANFERQNIGIGLLIRVSYWQSATVSKNGLRRVFELVLGFVYFLTGILDTNAERA